MKQITYLFLTLLVLLPAFSTAGYGNKLAKSDELISVVNKEFEIYAPRQRGFGTRFGSHRSRAPRLSKIFRQRTRRK
jgi:hypothetical protein